MSFSIPPQPALARLSMTPQPWAPSLLRRAVRALFWRKGQPAAELQRREPWRWRRLLLLVFIAAGAWLGTDTMIQVLPQHGGTWLEQAILGLFALLFAWISAGFWTGVMGAWVLLRGGDRHAVTNVLKSAYDDGKPVDPQARTAIVMPICNEHVPTVFGGLRATYESLQSVGLADRFDFFLLSDTSQSDLRAAEQAAFSELRAELGTSEAHSRSGLYYRWRQRRAKRKAGNVSDFCRRWGRNYRYMVVLDADSVMTGDCLNALVRLMEAHPDAGIIQTSPRACGHLTLHARMMQFGARVYGPIFTAGMHFWQLGESHYWGHNAIIRVAPFMAHCALAPIVGRGPLSGEIMSHDFVEAALMRRAGWKVWIAHDLPGSYEQVPPNLIEELQRDRRWCHGNLQNSRLMTQPGLHPVHRSVFFTGLISYLSAPLWLGFLLLSTLLLADLAAEIPRYFVTPYQLFPLWPTANFGLMLTLFSTTVVLLIGPKLVALAVLAFNGQARQFGGVARLLLGALLEFVYNMLLAPVRMLFHSQFVLAAWCGWRSGWTSPQRDDGSTRWLEAFRRHGPHLALTALWIVAIVDAGAAFPWWLTPIFAGLLLAVPLSVWGSRVSSGERLLHAGLLQIPEERQEPAVLRRARRYAHHAGRSVGFIDAVLDPNVRDNVLRAFSARSPAHGLKAQARALLVQHAVHAGPSAVTAEQRMRLLGDAQALSALAEAIKGPQANAQWAVVEPAGAEAIEDALQRPQGRSAPKALEVAEAR
jgi:membrane glycosyltransferase